jgi:hypothetical protein
MLTLRFALSLVGWLPLGVIAYMVHRRDKTEAAKNESYTSPLTGVIENVPPSLYVQRYLLWAAAAAPLGVAGLVRKDYFFSVPYFAHVVVALYCAWVYRRGREPKIMGGYRELPNPPSLLGPK